MGFEKSSTSSLNSVTFSHSLTLNVATFTLFFKVFCQKIGFRELHSICTVTGVKG